MFFNEAAGSPTRGLRGIWPIWVQRESGGEPVDVQSTVRTRNRPGVASDHAGFGTGHAVAKYLQTRVLGHGPCLSGCHDHSRRPRLGLGTLIPWRRGSPTLVGELQLQLSKRHAGLPGMEQGFDLGSERTLSSGRHWRHFIRSVSGGRRHLSFVDSGPGRQWLRFRDPDRGRSFLARAKAVYILRRCRTRSILEIKLPCSAGHTQRVYVPIWFRRPGGSAGWSWS